LRLLPNKLNDVNNLQDCESQASAAGYNVLGVQNGNECGETYRIQLQVGILI